MKNLKTNILFKVAVIVVIILLLLIPASMVRDLIWERENIQNDAIGEVSEKWGASQTITGPFITIPYDKYVKQYSEKDSVEKIVKLKKYLHFLPETLLIKSNISPEKRYRGIYEIVVYESQIMLSGIFSPFDLSKFDINPSNIHFDMATLNIGIPDLKGIEKQIELQWNNDRFAFNPGTTTKDIVVSGINSPVLISLNDSLTYNFSLEIDLKGSQNLFFVPMGKTTDVIATSNWANPSFGGTFLPDEHHIDQSGFDAKWNILHLNRNFPQSWSDTDYGVVGSSFGVNLLLPVDHYQKSLRVVKYAILFLAFTFLVFFFVEVLNKVFIHPIQYTLVGIAIVVFYSLLLALSEQIKFNMAYIISAIATLALITAYVLAILKSKKVAFLIFGVLAILYGFIFTILQLQDYSLLIGSIGVFVILALVMYFSRRIDWYSIKLGNETERIK
ncbi:MAG: cell envelope integrity protein CreD [Bacteroidales bacterium]|nr:cell envelope integrity protein CreD [Bacteroidales bacterium]MCF8404217.1 cell envelope integrity protein CreD [Bacteroidales bacterium]